MNILGLVTQYGTNICSGPWANWVTSVYNFI